MVTCYYQVRFGGHELTIDECRRFSPLFDEDLFDAISLESSLAGKKQIGGTSPEQVKEELARAKVDL